MNVKIQMGVVFNLDKCLGCNTCTVACKNVWTNREGAKYMFWNNVETKPGIGYPKEWENQDEYRGGWVRTGNPNKPLELRTGGKKMELLSLFYNPYQPELEDYVGKTGTVTFTYEDLHSPTQFKQQPVARPVSDITGEQNVEPDWGVNWEDNAAGANQTGNWDYNFSDMTEDEKHLLLQYRDVFMIYLPRICNHCVNPGCVAACPSGAAHKREEDGVVLVDQKRCRGWRYCVTSCPYKKLYYNWLSGKMEKCILCYPRLETGQAPACMHSCVGKIRYMGPILYDMDQVTAAATVDDKDLVKHHRELILDPTDPEVIKAARENGITEAWLEAATRSPVFFMFKKWKIALPLHPEFRTMPSLFYIPPESPVLTKLAKSGDLGAIDDSGTLPDLDNFRVPLRYLARLLAAGNVDEVKYALSRQLALRQYRRSIRVDGKANTKVLDNVGLSVEDAEHMHRLLCLAFYNERFVIPTGHRELGTSDPYVERGFVGFEDMSPLAIKRREWWHPEPHRRSGVRQ